MKKIHWTISFLVCLYKETKMKYKSFHCMNVDNSVVINWLWYSLSDIWPVLVAQFQLHNSVVWFYGLLSISQYFIENYIVYSDFDLK